MPARTGGPQDDQLGVVVGAPLLFDETVRCLEPRTRSLLDHHQRVVGEPATSSGGSERPLGEALSIGRIEEHEGERRERVERSELRRIAPEDFRDAAQPERLDVGADERARLRSLVDQQRKGRPPRDRLQPERARAGEQVEHARARDRIAIGVDQDVEQGLA
jgi:hypothetical protein